MAGKMSPGSMGLVGGGMAGAVAGFMVAGPLGAVAGAIIGSESVQLQHTLYKISLNSLTVKCINLWLM